MTDGLLAELSGADPYPALARMRAARPVAPIDELGGWLVTSHTEAVRILRDPATFTVDDPRFSTAQVVGQSMLSRDGAEHRRHRTAFGTAFRPRDIVTDYRDRVERLVAGLLEPVRPHGTAELRTALAGPLSVAVVATALGLDDLEPARVLDWYADIVAAVSALSAGSPAEADGAMRDLDRHVRGSMARAPALHEATNSLTADEVVSNAAVMMFGGIETTEGMIANALRHVLADPAIAAQVRNDRDLLDAAVEESLRLEPAAAALDRYATRDVELAGSAIQRGDLVRISVTAANRDPRVFDAPDVFDLRRPGVRAHLAFAQGPHVCIAADLARLETRAALSAVLTLPGARLDPSTSHGVTGLVFRKPQRLTVRWDC